MRPTFCYRGVTITNSGEQIPKLAQQNSETCRFLVSHYIARRGGRRFLRTVFSILVSGFNFSLRDGILDPAHFSFLDSRFKPEEDHSPEITKFSFLISRFKIQASKRPMQIPKPLVPRFTFRVSGFNPGLVP